MTKFLFGFLLLFTIMARADFQVPRLSGPVMDEVGILRTRDSRELEAIIRDYNSLNKAQIQVYVISSLQGLTIEEASIKITDQWKLGTAKKDNGILFLIAPNDRRVRIEVGQGLEGTLPDAIAKRIVDDEVLPYFKARDMSTGVVTGVYQIIKYIDQEYADQHLQAPEAQPETGHKAIPGWLIIFILLLLLFIGRFLPGSSFGGRGGGGFYGGGGFGGGGGGGGWSGGGGGFSGGGASGSW